MQTDDKAVTVTDIPRIEADVSTTPPRPWLKPFRDVHNFNGTTPSPPPDGGWLAWAQVVGGFLVIFLCWGFINSFGVFQLYYSTVLIVGTSASSISWIGSMQIFLLSFVGAYSGAASDSGYFRLMCVVGVFFFVVGVFLTSICTQYWQLLLAHGICTGIGNGLIFIPTLSVASTYFSPRRRSLAIGLMFCGTATGGMLLPLIFGRLLPKIGFGWTMRVFGLISLVLFATTQALVKKRVPPKDDVRIFTFEVFQNKAFVLFVVGSFFNFMGMFFAFFYLPSYARIALNLSFTTATNLLLVINGMGIPGRLFPVWLADQRQWKGVSAATVQIPFNLATCIIFFSWIAVKSEGAAYVFAVIYGLAASGVQVLFPAGLADMTTDARKSGGQMGWGFTITSFACLLGNPIGGLTLRDGGTNYLYAQIYGGVCIFVGFMFTAAATWRRKKIED